MTNFQPFTLDSHAARQADSGGRIEATGKYVGVIKTVEFIISRTGSKGFEFNFETDNKEYTKFKIWTIGKSGQTLAGSNQINAIMACAGVKTLTPTDQQLEKYDFESGGKVLKLCTIAPELANKRIGFLLQRENFVYNGNPRHQMNFYAAFQVGTELMAKEILDRKTEAETLPKAFTYLMNIGDSTRAESNPSYPAQQNNYGQPQQRAPERSGNGYEYNQGFKAPPKNNQPDSDDDLPF